MTRGLRATVAIAGVLACTASAQASTVGVEGSGKAELFIFRAAPGEDNRVRAEASAGVVTVRDAGAELVAGDECVQVNDHKATCDRGPGPLFQSLSADLGNGDDRAEADANVVWGQIFGGAGDDHIEGGEGNDLFMNGGKGADLIAGRGGIDGVIYVDRSDDVTVTLADAARNDGGRLDGEGDKVLKVENAAGGAGDDLLVGTSGENSLGGADGADLLRGGGGEDTLFGGEGADTLRGQGGPDGIQPQAGKDKAFGGGGADVMSVSGDGSPDRIDGGGDPQDELQVGFAAYRTELDGKANDGVCDQQPCATSSEGDNVTGIRILGGTFGGDLMIGTARDETFKPSLGNDIVKAKGGDDLIDLSNGDGADNVACGAGTDTVDSEQGEDTLTGCES